MKIKIKMMAWFLHKIENDVILNIATELVNAINTTNIIHSKLTD